MSIAANKRQFIEAAQAVVKASQIEPEMLQAVFGTLAQVVSDATGRDCELVLRLKRAAPPNTEGASK